MLCFDEPCDGLVYAAAASLGFASLGNMLYIALYGPAVTIGRASISTLAHIIFASFWGYGLGVQAQEGRRGEGWWLAAGLAVAAIVHGLFNILVLAFVQSLAWPLLALFLVALGLVWTLNRFRWAQRVSPFWLRRNYPQVECPRCRRRIFITSRFCQFCREPVAVSRAPAPICSNCRNVGRPDAAYCPRCGDRLLRR